MPYLYILKSRVKNKYYIGSTKNWVERLKQHNSGSVRSTKAYRPWQLIYKETYKTITAARKRENQIKSWKSTKNIKKLILKAPSSSG